MTGPGEDSQKHKSENAAKYLAESFFGLNMNPAEVGGEVLFDEYDDVRASTESIGREPDDSDELDAAVLVTGSRDTGREKDISPPNRFEENLDELIVFSVDDDDDTIDKDEEEDEEEEDDENFDFGDEDDEEEDDDDDFDDDDDDDEEDEEEEEDELEDEDLDFGNDVIDPVPKKSVPVARESRPEREQRGSETRPTPARPTRVSSESRDHQQSKSEQSERRPASRDNRSHGSPAARSTGSTDRPHAAKSVDAGHKSGSGDEDYWKELDGWVWEDEPAKKPAVASTPRTLDLDDDEIDEVDEEDVEQAAPAAAADKGGDEGAAPRRGRRRGGRGRGRGRGRREEKDTAEAVGKSLESSARAQDFDDDFSEIMFEEDQEDFVSVSAGSVKAQRRIIEEPPSPAARIESDELEADDDLDDETIERAEEGEERPGSRRRGRRGRRGRGRGPGTGPEESREPVRKEVRPAASARRPVRDEDNMDDDEDDDDLADDDLADDDAELSDFGDLDDEVAPPRRREGAARAERVPERGRGRDRGDRPPRESGTSDRSDRQPARERRPVAAAAGRDERHGSRPPHVAPEFQGIPTWEEAIGSLEIRTPTEEHARRAESRGRRDGGRPPRRRN